MGCCSRFIADHIVNGGIVEGGFLASAGAKTALLLQRLAVVVISLTKEILFQDAFICLDASNQLSSMILAEGDGLGVEGPAVRTDAVGLKAVLHVHPTSLVEPHSALLHDLENFGLAPIIEACAAVARLDVAAEVKCRAGETRLHVAGESGGQAGVDVIAAWNR